MHEIFVRYLFSLKVGGDTLNAETVKMVQVIRGGLKNRNRNRNRKKKP